jgi:glucuronoarabinoxylan endo-1,4-beta-xylanase
MFKQFGRAARTALTIALLIVSGLAILLQAHATYAASSVTINGAMTYQTIDGFGFSEAFGQASAIKNVGSPTAQRQMLDLLFSPTAGAGFTILRNIIPSDANHTIEPNSPGSPTAPPQYVWSGDDWGQVWLSQQAQGYGVRQFYADAWGAPAFMKTNNSDINGGTLCGAPGAATCSTGDWRQAYANYLVQYIKDYQSVGIPLTEVGYVNEPNLAPSYSGMVMSPAQTEDFAKILGPTLTSAGLSTRIVCCDAEGWNLAPSYTSAITGDPAASAAVSIISSHGYTGAPNSPLSSANGKPIWETEWSTFDNFDAAWDDNSDASGFTWAQHIYTGLTSANLSAFLYWWGVSNGSDNEQLIQLNGTTVTATKRLWAMANYSRFVRPGAVRIGASTADGNLQVTAYKNTDGSLAIVVLNTATSDIAASFSLQNTGIANGSSATPYLTNGANSMAAQTALPVSGGSFSATIPARSLVTYNIPAASSGGTPTPTPTTTQTPTPTPTSSPTPTQTPPTGTTCAVHYAITNQWPGGFGVNLTITNTGTTAINGWSLQFAFPNGQTITQLWNGSYTQSGANVTITNLSYNATIAPGATLNSPPGFNGSWSGSNNAPGAFTLNGAACSVV